MIQVALVVILTALPRGSFVTSAHYATVQNKDQEAKKKKNQKGLSDDEVSFIEAARKGDNETVKRFLDAGMDVNLLDKRDNELLVPHCSQQNDLIVSLPTSRGSRRRFWSEVGTMKIVQWASLTIESQPFSAIRAFVTAQGLSHLPQSIHQRQK